MKDFFKKEEYSEEDIQDLIDNKIEESLNLEFKAAGALDQTDGKKRNFKRCFRNG